ncbi:uncharacterized protein C5L36_0D00285 [Pichia kudriavzevii]|uniref:Plastocyanin-like domain-containing protein n=2 Tax=Pichia kudriavzevii TaxID=4909 RepID=A0A2U9R8N4_PICKU|nr:uncharacterized protein C5L36_0D00285 [Pichia kudriavzevii]AWU77288.1 hypothetical protein C5L36_0D00285 [Pichia kudriavzevii]
MGQKYRTMFGDKIAVDVERGEIYKDEHKDRGHILRIVSFMYMLILGAIVTRFCITGDLFSQTMAKGLPVPPKHNFEVPFTDFKSVGSSMEAETKYQSAPDHWKGHCGQQFERMYDLNITSGMAYDRLGNFANVTLVNHDFYGPLIEASVGDTLIIRVNSHTDNATVKMELDGDFSSTVETVDATYIFKLQIHEHNAGTFLYRIQSGDASLCIGPLIVHSPCEDSNIASYSSDFTFLLTTDNIGNTEDSLSHFLKFHHGTTRIRLINTDPMKFLNFSTKTRKFEVVESKGEFMKPIFTKTLRIDPNGTYSLIFRRTSILGKISAKASIIMKKFQFPAWS